MFLARTGGSWGWDMKNKANFAFENCLCAKIGQCRGEEVAKRTNTVAARHKSDCWAADEMAYPGDVYFQFIRGAFAGQRTVAQSSKSGADVFDSFAGWRYFLPVPQRSDREPYRGADKMGCSGKGAAGRFTPCREEYLRLPDAKEADYGPCYWIPELPMPDDVVFLNQENIQSFLPDAFSWLAQEISYVLPCAAVIQNGQAVTICRSVRISNEAAEAGLETLFVYRGRGYAGLAVMAWARAVRKEGRMPLYSTS